MNKPVLVKENEEIMRQYIASWLNKDLAAFLELLAPNALITECYGATYLGTAEAKAWFQHWNAPESNQVLDWTILSHYFDQEQQTSFFEWQFHYRYKGKEATFNGITLLQTQTNKGKITILKEFETKTETYRPYQS